MDLTIRTYQETDKPLYIQFYAGIYKYIGKIDPYQRQRWEKENEEPMAMEEFDDVFAHEGEIFVACDGDKVVGMCMVSVIQPSKVDLMLRMPSRDGKINMLYVLEEYRNMGVGERLFSRRESYVKDKGCEYSNLTVYGTNDAAHAMYRKHGFIDISIDMVKKIL